MDVDVDELEELFTDSSFERACEAESITNEVCGKPADLFVRWSACPECGSTSNDYYCIGCYTEYLRYSDDEGDGFCSNCYQDIWIVSVVSIR